MSAPETPNPGSDKPRLAYKLYGQDGRFIHLTCQDTPDMRRFTEWVRRFDRYGDTLPPPPQDTGGEG